jgi:beta-1,4-mannosyl-glycoprotein beta-1,4-N-acetylglucosaminyltransferase
MPMIYDCFTFHNELELLTLRLHELAPAVDYFVLVEATQTFQGNDKPLYYNENKEKFREFERQIIHIIVEFPRHISNPYSQKSPAWAREYYQREQIAQGLRNAIPSDLVIVSDVDEIISAERLKQCLVHRRSNSLTIFTMPAYSFYINRRVRNMVWTLGPRMIAFGQLQSTQRLRMCKLSASQRFPGTCLNRFYTRIWNWLNMNVNAAVEEITDAGWHFTSLGSWQDYRAKVDAFSHEELKESAIYRSETSYHALIQDITEPVDLCKLPTYVRKDIRLFNRFLAS